MRAKRGSGMKRYDEQPVLDAFFPLITTSIRASCNSENRGLLRVAAFNRTIMLPSARMQLFRDFILRNLEIKNFTFNGLYIAGANDIRVINCVIHDQIPWSDKPGGGGRFYGIYFHDGTNGLIEGNEIYNNPEFASMLVLARKF